MHIVIGMNRSLINYNYSAFIHSWEEAINTGNYNITSYTLG